jgi:hypothetical protein
MKRSELIQIIKEEVHKLNEIQNDTYFKTYTDCINAALDYANKKGFETDKEELANIVGVNSKRPRTGQTTKVTIPLYKNSKLQRKYLHIQVYGMENSFELTKYIN